MEGFREISENPVVLGRGRGRGISGTVPVARPDLRRPKPTATVTPLFSDIPPSANIVPAAPLLQDVLESKSKCEAEYRTADVTSPDRIDSVLLELPTTEIKSTLSADAPEFIPRSRLTQPSLPGDYVAAGDCQSTVAFQLNTHVHDLTCTPAKFECIANSLTKMLSISISSEEHLHYVVNSLFEYAVTEPNFRYSCARLYNHLSKHLVLDHLPETSFRTLLLQRCQQEHSVREELLSVDSSKVRGFAMLLGELFLHLQVSGGQGRTQHIRLLGVGILEILTSLLQAPIGENLKCVAQVLKLTGAALEDMDKDTPDPPLSHLMQMVKTVTLETEVSKNIKALLLSVVELRASDWGRFVTSPVVRNDPAITANLWMDPVFYGPDGQIVSQEEVSFLAAEMSDSDSGDVDDECSDMDDEAQDAFEQFLEVTGQQ